MKVSLLIKVCKTMYYNCKNKTLSITFYETPIENINRKPSTRKAYDNNLPAIYYIISVAPNYKSLSVMSKDLTTGDISVLSKDNNFDFNDLLKNNVKDYTVHTYEEILPFSKNSSQLEETGIYKSYCECLKYDASLFIDLFRLIGETVSIVIKSKDKYYIGHYIEGKVFIVEFTDWSVTVYQTDLYSLIKHFPNYEIIDFVAYPVNMKTKSYLHKLEKSCQYGNLQFIKNF